MKNLILGNRIRFCCSFLTLAAVIHLFAADLNAQTWQIFTPDYSYNSGNVTLEKVIRTKYITDVIRAEDGTVWLSCADTYPVCIKNIDQKVFETGTADADKMKEINYIPSASSRFVSLPNGEIWLITRQNLLRMKNGNWEGFNSKNSNKASQSSIPVPQFDLFGEICKDFDGHLWLSGVSSENKKCGLARLDNNAWTYYMFPDEISSKILAGSSGKGLKLLAGKEMNYAENPLLKLVINNCCFDAKGNAWMSFGEYNDQGLFRFSNGEFIAETPIVANDIVYDIQSDKEGKVHVATSKGLYVVSNNMLIPYETAFSPVQMKFDNDDMLWWSGGTREDQGKKSWKSVIDQSTTNATLVTRYNKNDKSAFEFTSSNTPMTQDVTGVYFDGNNTKYFIINGTKTGLFILQDKTDKNLQWKVISEYNDGEREMEYYTLTSGYNDKDWNFTGISRYGSERNLNEFKEGAWQHTSFKMSNEPTGLLSVPLEVDAIARDKNNNLYLGTSNYVYKYDKLSNIVEGFEKSKISKQVNCMSADQSGIVWIGTTKGLASYDGSNLTYFDKSNSSIPGSMILNLLSDRKDRTWVGTPNGLLCIEKEKQTIYNNKNGLNNERIVALAENSSGKVFIATSNINTVSRSLNYEDNGVMKEEALPELTRILKMVFDRNDNLWIGCEGSLICRKNNGEYLVYNKENSPIQPSFELGKLFVIGNEIWLVVELPYEENTSQTSALPTSLPSGANKETQILNGLKPKLAGLQPKRFTLVFQPESR